MKQKIDLLKIEEVLQKEWSYIIKSDAQLILATPHVRFCTVFYGSDALSDIGFMCHFDVIGSEVNALTDLFIKIEEHIPRDRNITCHLDGGYSFMHSVFVRRRIRQFVSSLNKKGWSIDIVEESYNIHLFKPFTFERNSAFKFSMTLGKGISYCLKSKEIGTYSMKPLVRTIEKKPSIFKLFSPAICSKNSKV